VRAPRYRCRGETVIVLLAGCNKRTQARDIDIALRLARTL
jgi:putative component of toxin-antitoxin plasmid stabilization module